MRQQNAATQTGKNETMAIRSVRGTMASTLVCTLMIVGAGFLASGCGGGGNTGASSTLSTLPGTPTISPEAISLEVGENTTFYPGTEGVDRHKVSEGFRVQEEDGGTLVTAADSDSANQSPVRYTAPAQPGTYHVEYVWDAGTSSEKRATATITVKKVSYFPADRK